VSSSRKTGSYRKNRDIWFQTMDEIEGDKGWGRESPQKLLADSHHHGVVGIRQYERGMKE